MASTPILARSSASLFHFTPKLEFLKGILSEGFRYSHLADEIPFGGYVESLATVMSFVKAVCFCDIPLSLSGEHRRQYGQYALAMHRDWGMTVGLTPVRYTHRRSPDLRNYTVEPRSIYLMDGESRQDWQHSIPPVEERRYSITFRTMR